MMNECRCGKRVSLMNDDLLRFCKFQDIYSSPNVDLIIHLNFNLKKKNELDDSILIKTQILLVSNIFLL